MLYGTYVFFHNDNDDPPSHNDHQPTNQPTTFIIHLKHLIHGKMIWKSYFVFLLKENDDDDNKKAVRLVGWFDWQRNETKKLYFDTLSSLIIMEYHQQQQQQ